MSRLSSGTDSLLENDGSILCDRENEVVQSPAEDASTTATKSATTAVISLYQLSISEMLRQKQEQEQEHPTQQNERTGLKATQDNGNAGENSKNCTSSIGEVPGYYYFNAADHYCGSDDSYDEEDSYTFYYDDYFCGKIPP